MSIENEHMNATDYGNMGVAHLRESNFSEARLSFQKSLALDPADTAVLRLLVITYEATNNTQDAIAVISRLHNTAPDITASLLPITPKILKAIVSGAFGKAPDAIQAAIALADILAYHEPLGSLLEVAITYLMGCADERVREGDDRTAEKIYRVLLGHRPMNRKVHLALGHLLCRRSEWVAAARSILQAVDGAVGENQGLDGALHILVKHDLDILIGAAHNLVVAASRNRQDRGSIKAAANLYDALAASAAALGESGANLRQFAELSAWLAQDDGFHGGRTDTVDRCFAYLEAASAAELGEVHFRRGDYIGAISHFEHAVSTRSDPKDYAALAQAYLAHGQKQFAAAARWAIATPLDGAVSHKQVEETSQLLRLIEQSLLLPLNGDASRTDLWAQARSIDAWSSYAGAIGQHPYRAQNRQSPLVSSGTDRGTATNFSNKRRIFDCFCFFNELDMLDIRLSELYDYVDYFVLVEATFTHTGQEKPLYFSQNRERFSQYNDKIIHIIVDDDPGGFAWRREGYQRDAILRGLTGCRSDDMIIVSDADEILRPSVLARLAEPDDSTDQLIAPELDLYMYFLNLKAPEPWLSVAAAPYHLMKAIGTNSARYLPKSDLGQRISNAGWHFTWVGGAERFLTKMRSFAHEEGKAEFSIDPNLAAGMESNLHKFFQNLNPASNVPGLRHDLRPVSVDARFPTCIQRNIEHYRQIGWIAGEKGITP